MAYRVTLQIPLMAHDGNVWLFRRPDVHMQLAPQIGMTLAGRGIPQVLNPSSGWATRITGVGEDLDDGVIYVTLAGTREATYTKEELLEALGRLWLVDDEPLQLAEKSQQREGGDGGDYDDGYPKDPPDWS